MLWLVSGLRQKATADGQQLPRSGYAGGLRTGCWLVETALPDRRAGDVQPGNLVPGSTRMFCPVSWWNRLYTVADFLRFGCGGSASRSGAWTMRGSFAEPAHSFSVELHRDQDVGNC
jgi:hypothetical protein